MQIIKYEKQSLWQRRQKLVKPLASVPNFSQVVKYLEVRVSNPHKFCLYLDWYKPKLKTIDKEFKIIDKER